MTTVAVKVSDDDAPGRRRIRPSKTAVTVALEAIRSAGLPVEKVCINGGQIEIHCMPVEEQVSSEKHDDLEDW